MALDKLKNLFGGEEDTIEEGTDAVSYTHLPTEVSELQLREAHIKIR